MSRASVATLLGSMLLVACGGSAPPPTPPVASAAPAESAAPSASAAKAASDAKPPASAAPVASAAPSASPAAGPPTILIHRTEVYGTVVARQGKVLKVLALVRTSETPLPVGVKGIFFRKAVAGETGEWISAADVILKKLDAQNRGEFTLSVERPEAKAAETYRKDAQFMIQIDQ